MLQRPRPTVASESMPLLLRTLLWCYPREFRTAYARDDEQKTPFATFFESGTKRDGKKMWHDYEYYWSAYKYEPAGDEDGDSAADTELELE